VRDDRNSIDDSGVHIERINKNPEFWKECVEKAHLFLKNCLLPELMGNWYTRPLLKVTSDVIDVANDLPSSSTTTATTEDTDITLDEVPVYCLCFGP